MFYKRNVSVKKKWNISLSNFILTFIHQKELYELFMWALYVLYYDLLIK